MKKMKKILFYGALLIVAIAICFIYQYYSGNYIIVH